MAFWVMQIVGPTFPRIWGGGGGPSQKRSDFAEMATTSHHFLIVAGMITNSKSINIQSISHNVFLVSFWGKKLR